MSAPLTGLVMVQLPQQQQMLQQPLVPQHSGADDPVLGSLTMGPLPSQALCLCCFWNPAMYVNCCTQVNQNEQKAALYFGRYVGTLAEPGIYCLNPCGRELRTVSIKCDTLELKDIKVVDAKGNPIMISGVVTYALASAKKATIDVENPPHFIRLQSTTAMKQVASRYPYSALPGQACLQSEGPAISQELVQLLQQKVSVAGAFISNFEIVDLSYAPEIAQVMLVKQQAEALVDARRLIVSSAVDMAQQALAQLESKGVALSDGARERVTSNLLAVICSHQAVTPTVPMQMG